MGKNEVLEYYADMLEPSFLQELKQKDLVQLLIELARASTAIEICQGQANADKQQAYKSVYSAISTCICKKQGAKAQETVDDLECLEVESADPQPEDDWLEDQDNQAE